MSKTKNITIIAIGIALYCALSLSMRIPLGIGHIAIDLGYVVLAVYAYNVGGVSAAIVGGCAAGIMSILSGWFSLEWILANVFIGVMCGCLYNRTETKKAIAWNVLITIIAVAIGMIVIKTTTSYVLYAIPPLVKLPKSIAAFITDAIVMSLSIPLAMRLSKLKLKEYVTN